MRPSKAVCHVGYFIIFSLVVCSGILQVSGRLALYYLSILTKHIIGNLCDKLHIPNMLNERNFVITEVQQGKVHAAQLNNGGAVLILASTTLTKKRIKLIKIQSHPSMLI